MYYSITMTTISFKVSDAEARAIRNRARQERLTVSEFLRRQAMVPSRVAARIGLRRCPETGATIFEGSKDLPSLTVESTREILADFP